MLTLLLGICSSLAAEVVTWINKKLTGTVLSGDGAFLLAFFLAFVGASIKEFTTGVQLTNWLVLGQTFMVIFGVSQTWFWVIAKKLNLTVS